MDIEPETVDAALRGLLGLVVALVLTVGARVRYRRRTHDDVADPGLD